MPRAVKAILTMKTSNGKIRADLQGAEANVLESGKRHFRAQLNGGGGTIYLKTSNGSLSCKLTDTP